MFADSDDASESESLGSPHHNVPAQKPRISQVLARRLTQELIEYQRAPSVSPTEKDAESSRAAMMVRVQRSDSFGAAKGLKLSTEDGSLTSQDSG